MLLRYLPLAGLLCAVILIQLLTSATETTYYLTQLTMTAYYALVVIGLCVLMGYTGQASLGHAGFFAIGGYTSAALTTADFSGMQHAFPFPLLTSLGWTVERTGLFGEHLLSLHPAAAFVAALLLTALVAWVLGGPILRLKGHYLAMATLGFGIIVYRTVLATTFLGAADGITGVPPFPLFGGLTVSGDFSARTSNYYIAWIVLGLGMLLLVNLVHSRVGRALRSIHGSEEAASAMGVDAARYKLAIFVLSGLSAAAAGVFLTHYNGGIGPSEAGVMKSVRYVALVAVGGMANIWGALIMGVVLNFLSLRGLFGTYDDAVFGAILILIMLFAPQGLLRRATFAPFLRLLRGRSGRSGKA